MAKYPQQPVPSMHKSSCELDGSDHCQKRLKTTDVVPTCVTYRLAEPKPIILIII